MSGAQDHQGAPPTGHATARAVLVLLDDAAGGASLLALSSALAHMLKRDLDLVFVENSRLLAAAALPFTQVLPHAGAGWVPLAPQDIEQGFRTHAARLRALAARILPQRQVGWSLRVVRGNPDTTAASLAEESDLVMLPAPRTVEAPHHMTRRRTVVAVAQDGHASTRRAQVIATHLAQALDGVLETLQEPGTEHAFATLATPVRAQPDILVLPRPMVSARLLAERRCPVLLVKCSSA